MNLQKDHQSQEALLCYQIAVGLPFAALRQTSIFGHSLTVVDAFALALGFHEYLLMHTNILPLSAPVNSPLVGTTASREQRLPLRDGLCSQKQPLVLLALC